MDGSSCYMTDGNISEVIIKPVSIFNDPFRGRPHILVFCDTYVYDDKLQDIQPSKTNFRHLAL